MRKFIIHGELTRYIGRTVNVNCHSVRGFFEYCFGRFPEFRKYFINKIYKGGNFIFIDDKKNHLDAYCSDLILNQDYYHVFPKLEGQAGGPIMGFAMNALMGYGMQKLANKLNPVKSSGKEYEIITTNSWLYSSNDNRTEQGVPIPIIYGQLKVGSLVINSNISNFEFDYDSATILRTRKVDCNIFTDNPGKTFTFDQRIHLLSTINNFSILNTDEIVNDHIISSENNQEDPSKRSLLSDSIVGSQAKTFQVSQGNDSYNSHYSSTPSQGGSKLSLGPSSSKASNYNSTQSYLDNGSNNSAKPYIFPKDDDLDSFLRPQSSSDSCFLLVDQDQNEEKLTRSRVGSRGNYNKLESIGIYRNLDIISEGPIAGLALPITGDSNFDLNTSAFSNDHGLISLGYSKNAQILSSKDNSATFKTISFSKKHNKLLPTSQIDKDNPSFEIEINDPGSTYPPDLNEHMIIGNMPASNNEHELAVEFDRPLSVEDPSISEGNIDPDTSPSLDDEVLGVSSIISTNKLYALLEHKHNNSDDGFAMLGTYYAFNRINLRLLLDNFHDQSSWDDLVNRFLESNPEFDDSINSLSMTTYTLPDDFLISVGLIASVPHLGVLSLNQFRSDTSTFDKWSAGSNIGLPSNLIDTNENSVYEYIPVFNDLSWIYFLPFNILDISNDTFGMSFEKFHKWSQLLHIETDKPLELDIESMSNNEEFKNLINLGNSLSSSINEDFRINISPDNFPAHLDFKFREQQAFSSPERQRSSQPYCLDFGFATSSSIHTDAGLQSYMSDDLDFVIESLNDANRFNEENLKGMLRPYADIRGDSLTLDDINSITITKALWTGDGRWEVTDLQDQQQIIFGNPENGWHTINRGWAWSTCTRNYLTRQRIHNVVILRVPLASLLFQRPITIQHVIVRGVQQQLNDFCGSFGFTDIENTDVNFVDSFGNTFDIENNIFRVNGDSGELLASDFTDRYRYMIDYPQGGFDDSGEAVGGLYAKINAFSVFSGDNEFELTDQPDNKATTHNIGFGDKKAPISLFLRNENFADDFINKAQELIRSELNKPNFSFERATITTTKDAEGVEHTPKHIKIIPGVGSTLANSINGSPAYMYNQNNAWKLDDLKIINSGENILENTVLDEDIIEFLNIDAAEFLESFGSLLEDHVRGFYNDSLLYRAEVIVFRARNLGFSGTVLSKYCLTNIDCFCKISSLGKIDKIFITKIPDNPVWDNDGNSGEGMWTPIHPFSHERPAPLNVDNSNTENSVKINSPSYQDLGILLKIDSSNQSQEIIVEFNNNGTLKTASSVNIFDDYKSYVQGLDRPSLSRSGQTIAQGIICNNIVNNRKKFSLSVNKKDLNNQENLANPTTEARIDCSLEQITLDSSGQYTKPDDIGDCAALIVQEGDSSTFFTGRITGVTIGDAGVGYLTKAGGQIFDRSKIQIFNKLMGVENITLSSLGSKSNLGYQPNSVFYICGFIAKSDITPEELKQTPPSFDSNDKHDDWWQENSNFRNAFSATTNHRLRGRYSPLELTCFKAVAFVDNLGSIDSIKVIDSGYQLANEFKDITYEQDELCVHLNVSESVLSLLNGVNFQDTSVGISISPQLNYSSGFSSKSKYRANAQLSSFEVVTPQEWTFYSFPYDFHSLMSSLLWPGCNMIKQDLILNIPADSLRGDNFGKLSRIQMLRPGMGFSRNFNVNNLFEDSSFDDNSSQIKFFVSTNSDGEITRLTIDENNSAAGYGEEDQNLELSFSERFTSSSIELDETSGELDSFSWAYSIFLNNTPIRDHTGRFNFSKFDFNMSCGFFQNGNQRTINQINNLDNEVLSNLPNQLKKPLLENNDFRLPAQTKVINYPLYGPRNHEERDYYYTHTVSNPDISMVALSFKINELHYIYEGDEEIVTLNLMPIIGAILGYVGAGKLIEMLGGLMPDPQVQTNAGNTGPACGTAVTGGPGFGLNVPTASHASKVLSVTKFAKDLMSFGLQLIGGVLGYAIASKVPCPSFLCFKVGNLIKNSGEIWPAKMSFKIEYGIEGEDSQNWKSYTLTVSGCATSPFIKDVYLKDFPDLAHKSDPKNIKKRVIKVYRLTREMDPIQYGIMEARFKMDAELFSATEYIGGFFSYPNTALFAMRTNSKDLPDIPKREFIIKGKLVNIPSFYEPNTGTYGRIPSDNQEFFNSSLTWTSNPAWVIYDLLINPIYGLGKYGVKKEDIDEFSFLRFSKLADEPVTTTLEGRTYKERRFMCNLYVDQQKPAYEYIKSLLNLYNATLNFSGGRIYISDDSKRDPVMIFNNSNITESGFSYSSTPKTERLSACTVDYLDERDEYSLKSEYFEDNESIAEVGYVHVRLAGISITRKGEALRLARSKVLTTQMQKEIIQFETGLPASYLRIGDVIKVIDNNRLPNQSSGRILKISTDRRSVEIDIPKSALPNFTSLSIQCVKDEGDMDDDRSPQFEDYEVQNASGGFTINLEQAVDSSVRPGFTWMINKSSNSTFTPQQYQIKNLKEIDGLKFEVIAIEYNPDKFDLIEV